jgi:hypothetical protein
MDVYLFCILIYVWRLECEGAKVNNKLCIVPFGATFDKI